MFKINLIILPVVLGILTGLINGITSVLPISLILIILDYFNYNDYKKMLGGIIFLELFPISVGSFWYFYRTGNVDYILGITLLLTIIVSNYFGSLLIVDETYEISKKTIKYITSILELITSIVFFISAFYEKN